MKAAVIFDNFGPYHLARLQAAASTCDLLAIQVHARSAEYAWESGATFGREKAGDTGPTADEGGDREVFSGQMKRATMLTLLEANISRDVAQSELEPRLKRALNEFQPGVVFIPGWSSAAAFAALQWCVRQRVPVVSMSESTAWDAARSAWREAVKRRIAGLCSAALVGGSPHADYMVTLGMPREHVFLGYDAVDNGYFAAKAAAIRKQKPATRNQFGFPETYFLASARFIEKKNLFRLLQAYARYRTLCENSVARGRVVPWSLVLLGDGPLRPALTSQLSTLRLNGHVLMPGLKQYRDLPVYCGLAGAFIHASTIEQWGLVVNEAMASGLPVLVSNRCGCAPDLVQEGINGFTFDPYNVEELAELMLKVSSFQPLELSAWGEASRRIISGWGPDRFANGLKQAMECALRVGPARPKLLQRIILNALILR